MAQVSTLDLSADSSPSNFSVLATALSSPSYLVDDLEPGTYYYFAVIPYNSLGDGITSLSSKVRNM